jgi:hypothetical protein
VYRFRVLDDPVVAVSVPVNVNSRRRERSDDVRLRPPGREGASIATAVLRQARRKERGVRVRRVPLVRPRLLEPCPKGTYVTYPYLGSHCDRVLVVIRYT